VHEPEEKTMNTVALVGKIASDIQLREYGSGADVKRKATFLLAVPRPVKDGTPDFIRVETWGKQAENLVRFNRKGSRIAVSGRLRSQFYNPDGGTKGGELRSSVVADEIVYLTPPRSKESPSTDGPAAGKGNK
jgi:single-strand DNA-binding protein